MKWRVKNYFVPTSTFLEFYCLVKIISQENEKENCFWLWDFYFSLFLLFSQHHQLLNFFQFSLEDPATFFFVLPLWLFWYLLFVVIVVVVVFFFLFYVAVTGDLIPRHASSALKSCTLPASLSTHHHTMNTVSSVRVNFGIF